MARKAVMPCLPESEGWTADGSGFVRVEVFEYWEHWSSSCSYNSKLPTPSAHLLFMETYQPYHVT